MRQVHSALVEVLQREYVTTARAKGLSQWRVVRRHALRNALIPVVTIFGLQTGRVFGAAVVVETVFALPGLARLAVDSAAFRDYSALQGAILTFASRRPGDEPAHRPPVRRGGPAHPPALSMALRARGGLRAGGRDRRGRPRARRARARPGQPDPPGPRRGARPAGRRTSPRHRRAGTRSPHPAGLRRAPAPGGGGHLGGAGPRPRGADGAPGGPLRGVARRGADARGRCPLVVPRARPRDRGGGHPRPGLANAMVAIGIVYAPVFARLVRGQTVAVREHEYVEAARSVGASDPRIMARHVWPNVSPPVLVQSSLMLGQAILEAALSFLGLGVQPPAPAGARRRGRRTSTSRSIPGTPCSRAPPSS